MVFKGDAYKLGVSRFDRSSGWVRTGKAADWAYLSFKFGVEFFFGMKREGRGVCLFLLRSRVKFFVFKF